MAKENHDLVLATVSQIVSAHSSAPVEAWVGRDWSGNVEIVSHAAQVDVQQIKARFIAPGKTQLDAAVELLQMVRQKFPSWTEETPLDDDGVAGLKVYCDHLDSTTEALLAQIKTLQARAA